MQNFIWSIFLILCLLSGCAKIGGGGAPSLLGGGDGSGIETGDQDRNKPAPASQSLTEKFRCNNAVVEVVVYETSATGYALLSIKRWEASTWTQSSVQSQQSISGSNLLYQASLLSLEIRDPRGASPTGLLSAGSPVRNDTLQCTAVP